MTDSVSFTVAGVPCDNNQSINQCESCGKPLVRKRYSNGRVETPHDFAKRRFCDLQCVGVAHCNPYVGPPVYCLYCGSELIQKIHEHGRSISKRKFCGMECKAAYYRKSDATEQAKLERSRKYKEPTCKRCGSTENLQVHHIDRNWNNASPCNLVTLCRSCHLLEHPRKGVPVGPPRYCRLCGAKAAAQYLCSRHYHRLLKYGNPLLTKVQTSTHRYELMEVGPYD